MPERYRDAKTGRWVSTGALPNLAAYLQEKYEAGTRRTEDAQRFELTPGSQPPPVQLRNWSDKEWAGGGVFRTAGGSPLSGDAYDDPPAGAASFQLRFIVPSNPDYMRGWLSYTTLPMSDWDRLDDIIASMEDEKGATGVGAIIFHYYY